MGVRNYSAATKVDINNRYTIYISPFNGVSISGVGRNEGAFLYWDDGVGRHDGDYSHHVEAQIDSTTDPSGGFAFWQLTNDIDDLNGLISAGKDLHSAFLYKEVSAPFRAFVDLYEMAAGSLYSDTIEIAPDTHYYFTPERDETAETLELLAYTDSARTNLHGTSLINIHENEDFRYSWAASSANAGTAPSADGFSQNFDLREVIAGSRRRRLLQ